MVERICPECKHGNPLENRYCGRCGTSLEYQPLLPPQQETALTLATANLPLQLKHVGKAVAVSLVALAAEAGLAWLRHRVERMQTSTPVIDQSAPAQHTTSLPRMTHPALPSAPPAPLSIQITILSQRVVETWEHGLLTRQTIERTIWRRES